MSHESYEIPGILQIAPLALYVVGTVLGSQFDHFHVSWDVTGGWSCRIWLRIRNSYRMHRDENRARIRPHYWQYAWCAALLVISQGCGQSRPDYVLVSGEVTFDGQPIEVGQIRFNPVAGTSGPITISEIRQGRYSTEKTLPPHQNLWVNSGSGRRPRL